MATERKPAQAKKLDSDLRSLTNCLRNLAMVVLKDRELHRTDSRDAETDVLRSIMIECRKITNSS